MSELRTKDREEAIAASKRPPVCSDHDKDCDDIEDKVSCWLYDPCKGRCPYLSSDQS